MNKEILGTLLAIITALISGVAIVANKIFIVDMEPAVFTAIRALIIGIGFMIIMLLTGNSKKAKRKTGRKISRKTTRKMTWIYLLSIGIIGGAFAFLLFFSGLKLTTGGNAAFLHKTMPLYIAVLAFIFLKEKITGNHIFAMFLMIIGTLSIYMAVIEPSILWLDPSLGNLLVIGATLFWAIETIIAKKVMKDGESNFVVSFARMFIGAIVLFSFIAVTGSIESLLSITQQQILNLSISTAILFAYVFCWYYSIKLISVSKASTLLLLAPVVSMILCTIILGEPITALQLFGSALILAGSYIVIKIRSNLATGV